MRHCVGAIAWATVPVGAGIAIVLKVGMLTKAQIEEFKREGVLILRGFIDQAQVSEWRSQFWAHIQRHYPECDPDDTATWPSDFVIPGGFSVDVSGLPQMQAVVEQLGGGELRGGMGGTLVVWPTSGKTIDDWAPGVGHVDGYGPGGWSGGLTLQAVTYLDDVHHGGGAHLYWPRSHLAAHRFFLTHPEQYAAPSPSTCEQIRLSPRADVYRRVFVGLTAPSTRGTTGTKWAGG